MWAPGWGCRTTPCSGGCRRRHRWGWAGEGGGAGAEGGAVNGALPAGTRDAGWMRAFHATVPALLKAFRPQVLVTQCGVDTHKEDPLADLALSVDGHRAIYQAFRELVNEHGFKWRQ